MLRINQLKRFQEDLRLEYDLILSYLTEKNEMSIHNC